MLAVTEARKVRRFLRRGRLAEAAECLAWAFRYHALGEFSDRRQARVICRLIAIGAEIWPLITSAQQGAEAHNEHAARARRLPRLARRSGAA